MYIFMYIYIYVHDVYGGYMLLYVGKPRKLGFRTGKLGLNGI